MAGQGVAPCFLAYEASVTLVHFPATFFFPTSLAAYFARAAMLKNRYLIHSPRHRCNSIYFA